MSIIIKRLMIGTIAIGAIAGFFSCQSGIASSKKNDTTIVLNMLLDSAIYKPRLANAAQLNKSAFADTVFFLSNKILAAHLSAKFNYKLMTEDDMCRYMAIRKKGVLQFLSLDVFKKNAKGYQVALGTHCMYRTESTSEQSKIKRIICEREKYCNAVLHMDVIKKATGLTGRSLSIEAY